MEKTIYKGVYGVFIPIDELEYIRETIKANRLLMESLINELAKDNPKALELLLKNS